MKPKSDFLWAVAWAICLAAMANCLDAAAANPSATLTVQADQPGPKISPTLYGIFFEEINCAGDGGLYAELVRNRSFEDSDQPEHWSLVTSGAAKGAMAIDTTQPMGENNPRALKLTITETGHGRVGVANDGYWGIALRQGEAYELSLSSRAGGGFAGPLAVSLESRDGKVYAQKEISGLGANWRPFRATLTADATDPAARLVISASQPGTVWLDMISLFPKKTWQGRANGLRPDLAEMLRGLKPAFVRFPGGCWVEGETLALSYRWKQTVGPVAERRNQYNIWKYYSTHGLGYREYLQLCADLGAEPLFVINCGMSHKENVPMDQLGPWVQDALDAIEYANGPPASGWGAVRARNGHPAAFNLKYMEIGNENGGPAYEERYAAFYKAIKAKYPQMRLIADEWRGLPKESPLELIDEHYYNSPAFFIQNAAHYDAYDRHGPKVYVGEYAVTQNCGQGNLRAALGEAAFMTGLERNSDVVVMASYAPLFANVNYKKWNPDLINFDGSRVYGTPSYYVQKMFAENRGDVVLPVRLQVSTGPQEPNHGAIGLGTWDTQAEFKDIQVRQGEKVLFDGNAAAHEAKAEVLPQGGTAAKQDETNPQEQNLKTPLPAPWRVLSGDWQVQAGALQQTAAGNDRRAIAGDPAWSDYTLSLKARKLGGAEGFLILFHAQDDNNWLWWNLGGWGNSQHGLEQGVGGSKSLLGRAGPGKIETGRWYDIRIELKGPSIRCFLDGRRVHDVLDARSLPPLHAVAGRADKTGEVILKVVNVAGVGYETQIRLNGVKQVRPSGMATILTSPDPADENSLDQPLKVAPVQRPLNDAAPNFRYTFPANSVTVLRVKAE